MKYCILIVTCLIIHLNSCSLSHVSSSSSASSKITAVYDGIYLCGFTINNSINCAAIYNFSNSILLSSNRSSCNAIIYNGTNLIECGWIQTNGVQEACIWYNNATTILSNPYFQPSAGYYIILQGTNIIIVGATFQTQYIGSKLISSETFPCMWYNGNYCDVCDSNGIHYYEFAPTAACLYNSSIYLIGNDTNSNYPFIYNNSNYIEITNCYASANCASVVDGSLIIGGYISTNNSTNDIACYWVYQPDDGGGFSNVILGGISPSNFYVSGGNDIYYSYINSVICINNQPEFLVQSFDLYPNGNYDTIPTSCVNNTMSIYANNKFVHGCFVSDEKYSGGLIYSIINDGLYYYCINNNIIQLSDTNFTAFDIAYSN
jgi:hypothetical protein